MGTSRLQVLFAEALSLMPIMCVALAHTSRPNGRPWGSVSMAADRYGKMTGCAEKDSCCCFA